MWKTVIYRRTELYDLVWAEPVRAVAARFGVSDVALAKTCRKLKVPVPGRGHWARSEAEREIRPPLPDLPAGAPTEIRVDRLYQPKRVVSPEVMAEVAREKMPEAAVVVAATLVDPHPLVATAGRLLARAKPDQGVVRPSQDRCLSIAVAPASLDRALRVMDALLKALEARQHPVEVTPVAKFDERGQRVDARGRPVGTPHEPANATRVRVEDEWIYFELSESWTVEHIPPPKPPRGLSQSQLRRWDWDHRATTRRIPNGVLGLSIHSDVPGFRGRCRDGKRRRLESCLNEFLGKLFLAAHAIKAQRAERDRHARECAEEERLHREAEERSWDDERRAKEITELVGCWRLARDMRELVAQLRAVAEEGRCTFSAKVEANLVWAADYADRVDPVAQLKAEIAQTVPTRDESAEEGGPSGEQGA